MLVVFDLLLLEQLMVIVGRRGLSDRLGNHQLIFGKFQDVIGAFQVHDLIETMIKGLGFFEVYLMIDIVVRTECGIDIYFEVQS